MEASNAAAVLGLLLASLPLLIITSVAIAVVGVLAALASLEEHLKAFLLPFRYWFLRPRNPVIP